MSRHNLNKGDEAMNLAVKLLEGQEYFVEKAKKVKFQPQDFFGLFDIIAVKEGSLKFVQVSTRPIYDKGAEFRQKMKDFPIPPGCSKEYWQYMEKVEWGKPVFTIRLIINGEEKKVC